MYFFCQRGRKRYQKERCFFTAAYVCLLASNVLPLSLGAWEAERQPVHVNPGEDLQHQDIAEGPAPPGKKLLCVAVSAVQTRLYTRCHAARVPA